MAAGLKTDKPKIGLNLDTFKSERVDREPFNVVIGGKVLTFTDPRGLDYRDLLRLDPATFFEKALSAEDFEVWQKQRVTSEKLEAFFNAYLEWFGLDRGEASGSSTS